MRISRKSIFIAPLILTLYLTSSFALDLQTCYVNASQHDAQWLVALSKYNERVELKKMALAPLLPNLAFTDTKNTITQTVNNAGVITPQQVYPSDVKALTLTQPVIRGKEYVGVSLSSLQTDKAQYQFKDDSQQLALRLITNYLDAVHAHVVFKTVHSIHQFSSANLIKTREMVSLGKASSLDEARALAEDEKNNAQELQALQSVEFTSHQLELQTGQIGGFELKTLERFDPREIELPTYESLVEKAMIQAPKLLLADVDTHLAQMTLRQAKAEHLPTLDLVAQVAQSSSSNVYFVNSQVNSKAVGLQLTVPIYGGGATSSKVRQFESEVDQANYRQEDLRNKIKLQLQVEYNTIKANQSVTKAYLTALKAAQLAMELNAKGSMIGYVSELDLLKAKSDQAQNFAILHQTRVETVKSWFKLKALLGEIDEAMISLFSHQLQ